MSSLPPWDIIKADPFADLLPHTAPKACPVCGTTWDDLHTDGRMGCAACYEAFSTEVRRALTMLHGTHRHLGKGQ